MQKFTKCDVMMMPVLYSTKIRKAGKLFAEPAIFGKANMDGIIQL